jgi:hypothetical protein
MKNILLLLFSTSLIWFNTVHSAEMRLNISSPKNKAYYLCIYGEGCINIQHKRSFPLTTKDMGDISKFVITDIKTKQMFGQSSNASCNRKVEDNQRITISGRVITKNARPYISGLRCSIN